MSPLGLCHARNSYNIVSPTWPNIGAPLSAVSEHQVRILRGCGPLDYALHGVTAPGMCRIL